MTNLSTKADHPHYALARRPWSAGLTRCAATWISAAFLIAGCDPYPSAPLQWESAHFVYRSDRPPDDPERLALHFEDHFDTFAAHFGVGWPTGERIDYRYIDDTDLVSRSCGWVDGTGPGCSRGALVLSSRPYHPHELIHAYLAQHGEPPDLLEEGMAQVFGCDVRDGRRMIEPDDSVQALWNGDFYDQDPVVRARHYDVARSFVHSLFERHGVAPLIALYGAMPSNASLEEVDAALRATLGESLSDADDAWRARGPRDAATLCRWVAECAAPALTDEPVRLDHVPSVDRDDTRRDAVRSVGVNDSGLYALGVEAVAAVDLTLRPCSPGRSGSTFAAGLIPTEMLVELDAEPHWLEIAGDVDTASVRLARSALAGGETCATSTPVVLPMGLGRWSRAIRRDSALCTVDACRVWVEVSAPAVLTAVVSGWGTVDAAIAQVCTGACGSCASTRTSSVEVTPGGPTILELTVTTAELSDAVVSLTSTTTP